jgi:hypothetical protein
MVTLEVWNAFKREHPELDERIDAVEAAAIELALDDEKSKSDAALRRLDALAAEHPQLHVQSPLELRLLALQIASEAARRAL